MSSLIHLAAPSSLSLGSVHTAMRLLKLRPYKKTPVQTRANPDNGARIGFCNWLFRSARDCIANSQVLSFIDEALMRLASKYFFKKGLLRNALMVEVLPEIRGT
jgi:hypothetical protein